MEIKAQLNYLRTAPRKVRSVVDLIRGKEIKEVEHQLRFLSRKSTAPILKLLKSAIADAKNNFNIDKENLFIKNILVNAGVPFRRWRSVSRGRTYPIMKRTSHIIMVLGVKEGAKIEKPSVAKPMKGELISKGEKTQPKIKKPVKGPIQKPKKQNWVKRIFRRKSM